MEAWEAGHAVIVGLAWMILALSLCVGRACAGVAVGVAAAWRWLYGRWSAPEPAEALPEGPRPDRASQAPSTPSKSHTPA
jgi:hypothetical protein